MKIINKIRYIAGVTLLATLASCSGTGSCPPDNSGGKLTLAIEAPSQYPAGVAVTAYLTMTNTSKINANNLVYTVPSPGESGNYTGVTITPYPKGAGEDCTNIAAGASCMFTAEIPAGSKPGSFTVIATPNGKQNTKTTQSTKSLQDGSISVTANLGLVDVPDTKNEYYILPNNQTTIANPTGDTKVMLSVWIKNSVEGLNKIWLVDDKGESLNASLVNKTPISYAQNSVLTYSVIIPSGKSLQHVQALSNVCDRLNIGENNNSACSNDADINLSLFGHGILSIQPTYVNMSESYNTQVITLTNIGNGSVSNIVYPNWATLGQGQFTTSENNCTNFAKLSAGQSCTIILYYIANSNSGQITPVFSYDDNNGTTPKHAEIVIPYTGTSSNAFSILTVQPTSISLTAQNSEQIITLTNTPGGSTAGATITDLTLPPLSAPLESVRTTCGNSLNVGASCSYTIRYSSAATAGANTLPFSYTNGIDSQTSNVAVDWAKATAYAYIPFRGLSNDGNIYRCIANESELSGCTKESDGTVAPISLAFVTLDSGEKALYSVGAPLAFQQPNRIELNILNQTTGKIISTTDKTPTALNVLDAIYTIQLQKLDGQTYAYFAGNELGSPSFFVCNVNTANADLTDCSELNTIIEDIHRVNVTGQFDFLINDVGNTSVYLPNAGYLGGIYNNAVESNGQFSNNPFSEVIPTAEDTNGFQSIVFKQINNTLYAYMGSNDEDSQTGVYKCTVSLETYAFTNCSFTSSFVAEIPFIGFRSIDSSPYAYMPTDYQNIGRCVVNSINGNLDNCTEQSIPNAYSPGNIVFNLF